MITAFRVVKLLFFGLPSTLAMAIIYKSGLPILVSVVLSVIFTQATPVDVHQDLEQRNNIHNLACSNAPNVIAGT